MSGGLTGSPLTNLHQSCTDVWPSFARGWYGGFLSVGRGRCAVRQLSLVWTEENDLSDENERAANEVREDTANELHCHSPAAAPREIC